MPSIGRHHVDLPSGCPRVVLVDDEPEMRAVLRSLLERAGFVVVAEAGDGAGGIAEVVAHRPDLVVTDLQMPGIDGLDLTRALRDSEPELPVVMITAFPAPDVVEKALAVGVSTVVDKGSGMTELVTVAKDVLRSRTRRMAPSF